MLLQNPHIRQTRKHFFLLLILRRRFLVLIKYRKFFEAINLHRHFYTDTIIFIVAGD